MVTPTPPSNGQLSRGVKPEVPFDRLTGNVQGHGSHSWVRVKGHVGQGQRSSVLNPV